MEYLPTNREEGLTLLGLSSYKEYLATPIWRLIRKEVFRRDCGQCRASGCGHKGPKEAHHVSYSLGVLVGLGCGYVVTLCRDHHQAVEFSNGVKIADLEEVRRKTIELLLNVKARPGKSLPKIGFWFKNQYQLSFRSARRVLASLRIESPYWHDKVCRIARSGALSSGYERIFREVS